MTFVFVWLNSHYYVYYLIILVIYIRARQTYTYKSVCVGTGYLDRTGMGGTIQQHLRTV